MSEARASLTATVAGNYILIAGGFGPGGPSKTVDVYNVVSNTWSVLQLSEARMVMSAAAFGNSIYFGGGATSIDYNSASSIVDVFELQ